MSTATVASLVESLQELELLDAQQWQALAAMQPRPQDHRELARLLIRKGWLSRYQVTKILRGEGEQLVRGPYRILDHLGEGGMGQVYKARHAKLGRIVALKVIHRDRLTDPKAVNRFLRETQAVAQLHHPNIVKAYDAGELSQGYYLAMEYVHGCDLGRLLRDKGRLPIHVACEYARQTALGLQHAHERGLVHRDIKPSNLLVASGVDKETSGQGDMGTMKGSGARPVPLIPSPLVKILDLGLARVERSASGDELSQVTCANLVIGTPDYIAPEQALRPHDVDMRADLYSLGCTLYHLVTGCIPFPADTVMEKLLKHRYEPAVPITVLRPETPPELAELIGWMLAKAPEDRPASAAAVAAALEPFCTEMPDALAAEPHPFDFADAIQETPAAPTLQLPVGAADASAECAPTLITDSPFADTPVAFRGVRSEPPRTVKGLLLLGVASFALTFLLIGMLLVVANSRPSFPGGDRADVRIRPAASKPAPLTFAVAADRPWQDTHVDVGPADRPVTIRVRGRWQHGATAAFCSAEGTAAAPWDVAVWPKALVMSLLARVGYSETIIPLHQTTSLTPPAAGRLFVQANDLELTDNRGKLTLEIEGGTENSADAGPPPLLATQLLERDWQPVAARIALAPGPWPEVESFRLHHPGAAQASRATRALMRLPSSLDSHPVRQTIRRVQGDPIDVLFALGDQNSLLRKPPQAVAFSPDGKLLAAGVDGYGIRIWDLEPQPPRELTTLKGHSDAVRMLGFAPDGQRLLSAAHGTDCTVRLWDHATGREVLRLGGPKPLETTSGGFVPASGLASASRQSPLLLTGGNAALVLWDEATGDALRRFANPEMGLVGCVAFTPDGRRALTAGEDRTLRVWDMTKGTQLCECPGHEKPITALAATADGLHAISGSEDTTIRLWELEKGTEVKRLDFPQAVAGLSLSADGRLLAAAGAEGAVVVWALPSAKEVRHSRIPGALSGIAFAPDGRHLALATRHGKTLVIRVAH